eukprot:5280662-Ditylum_brightwellii.AAC.1
MQEKDSPLFLSKVMYSFWSGKDKMSRIICCLITVGGGVVIVSTVIIWGVLYVNMDGVTMDSS